MKNGMIGCVAGALAALLVADAALGAQPGPNPYQGIVDRNVFALKPPPDPEATKPPPPPAPRITLTGIITLSGKPLALLKVMAPPGKPGAKAEEVPLTLSVGQKQEGVEVLDIHADEPKWVRVNNNDTITNLNFKDNGVNLASAAAPQGPPPPHMPQSSPGQMPTAAPNPAAYQGPRSIPRMSRMNPAYNQAAAGGNPNVYSAVPGPGAPAASATTPTFPHETPTTPEQAAIMEAAYTLRYQKQIEAGMMPSIPGSNPLLNPQNNQAQPRTRPY